MFVIAVSQWMVAKKLQLRLNLLENTVDPRQSFCDSCEDRGSSTVLKHRVAENHTLSNNNGDESHADEDGINIDGRPYRRSLRRSTSLGEAEQGLSRLNQDLRTSTASIEPGHPKYPSGPPTAKIKYTLGQAFFIVAGGLAIESKAFPEEARLTITPAGALELARLRLLEPVPAEVIDDKTKADPITKLLVCIQAGWFIIQSVARVSQGLPLTLIEIHVLTHVSVALLMYLFWFNKPYNALSPFVITSQELVDIAVLFSLHQPFSSDKTTIISEEDSRQDQETIRCVLKDDLEFQRSTQILNAHVERALRRLKTNHQHLTYRINSERTICFPSTYLVPKLSDYKSNPGFDLMSQDNFTRGEKRQTEWLYNLMPTTNDGLIFRIALLFASYGAFHLSAWNAYFPTAVERWFWRASGLCIVGSLPLFALGTMLSLVPLMMIFGMFLVSGQKHLNSILGKLWTKPWGGKIVIILSAIALSIHFVLCFLFLPTLLAPFARLYFLIEAFISFRAPAPRTHETVEWTQFWPHL